MGTYVLFLQVKPEDGKPGVATGRESREPARGSCQGCPEPPVARLATACLAILKAQSWLRHRSTYSSASHPAGHPEVGWIHSLQQHGADEGT